MTQKQIDKIIKRNKRRRTAQGIGAFFGFVTSVLGLTLVFGRDITGKNKK